MSTIPPFKKKSRWFWRWLRRVALSLLVLFVVVAVSIWWRLSSDHVQGSKELAAVVARLDESDSRWRWQDIEADLPPIPDEQNSMLVVQKVAESFGKWMPGRQRMPDGSEVLPLKLVVNRRLEDERLNILREELKPLQVSINLARTLKDYPRGRASIQLTDDVLSTRLDHAQHARQVAHLLAMDAERQLHEGRADGLRDVVRSILHLEAGLRDDFGLISALVRCSLRVFATLRIERILGMNEISDEDCRVLMALLDSVQNENLLLHALRGERAAFHHLFQNMEAGKVSFYELASDSKSAQSLYGRFCFFLYSYRLPEDHACYLTRIDKIIEIARLPLEEQMPAWALFDAEFRASRQVATAELRRLTTHLLLPAVQKVGEASLREKAHLRCAIVGLAAERFRLANKRWPKSLAELCPEYLAAVPRDPYIGEPLLFAFREDGIVIYSVGKDGTDDGGDLGPPLQDKLSPDLGFRLYNPDKRGLATEDD